MKKTRVVFFGTPNFSTTALATLVENKGVDVIAVVTAPDKPVGRGKKIQCTPIADFSAKNNLKIHKTSNINDDLDFLDSLKDIDLFIVIAFSQFLSRNVLSVPTKGCFNIHTSLLPKYRGAAPIQYAILNGDHQTGLCIQKMVLKMDAGDVVYKKEVLITPDDTSETLFNKLEKESAPAINAFIHALREDNLTCTPQDEQLVSLAPTIKKTDGEIIFSRESAESICNKVKAFTPWPGTYAFINGLRIKIHHTSIEHGHKLLPGTIDTSLGALMIGTTSSTIRLNKVQIPGKKTIEDYEFVNGHKNKFSSFYLTNAGGDKA